MRSLFIVLRTQIHLPFKRYVDEKAIHFEESSIHLLGTGLNQFMLVSILSAARSSVIRQAHMPEGTVETTTFTDSKPIPSGSILADFEIGLLPNYHM